jgi:hypothetical protein
VDGEKLEHGEKADGDGGGDGGIAVKARSVCEQTAKPELQRLKPIWFLEAFCRG